MEAKPSIDLADRLVAAHALLCTTTARVFELIVEAEDAEAYLPEYQDVVAWVQWNLGLSGHRAREWVRMANALRTLPHTHAAFAGGAVSLDQLRLILRVATPETEDDLLELASHIDVEDLRREVKELEAEAEEALRPERPQFPVWLNMWWHHDRLRGRFEITGADGVLVETALQRLGAKAPLDPNSGLFRDPAVRAGEALVQMSSESLADDRDHDRATIVVHTTAEDLVSQTGTGWDAANRVFFDTFELQLLACDARLQPAIDDANGITIGVGRTTRRVPPWLRRLVEGRDEGCRFPGCGRTRWLHIHHLREWTADEGPTNLDNLITLCGFHHRLIHRDNWRLEGNPNRHVTFRHESGHVHQPVRNRELFPASHLDTLLEGIDRWAEMQLAELDRLAKARAGPP